MNKELAELVRASHRRIVERRIYREMFPDLYEPIRRDFWAVLIECAR